MNKKKNLIIVIIAALVVVAAIIAVIFIFNGKDKISATTRRLLRIQGTCSRAGRKKIS